MAATVKTIEYDPNRPLASRCWLTPTARSAICWPPTDCRSASTVMTAPVSAPEVGNTLFLADIPLGTVVHNIELYPGQGAAMARQCRYLRTASGS